MTEDANDHAPVRGVKRAARRAIQQQQQLEVATASDAQDNDVHSSKLKPSKQQKVVAVARQPTAALPNNNTTAVAPLLRELAAAAPPARAPVASISEQANSFECTGHTMYQFQPEPPPGTVLQLTSAEMQPLAGWLSKVSTSAVVRMMRGSCHNCMRLHLQDDQLGELTRVCVWVPSLLRTQ